MPDLPEAPDRSEPPDRPGPPDRPDPAAALAAWAAGLTYADLPAEVRAAASRHLLDGLSCWAAGRTTPAASAARQVADGLGGPPEATLLGSGTPEALASPDGRGQPRRVGAPAAAFATAVAMHALDFDDTHAGGLVHATVAVAPAALAVAEQFSASRTEFVAAYVAGVEVVCRLGAAAPHAFHSRGVHATSACGTIAAAVAAGRLAGLDAAGLTAAIGIAASGSSGLLEFLHSGSSTKQLHPGFSAYSGILAARLAAAGCTGPAAPLTGRAGLFAALAGATADEDRLAGGLGTRWEAARITIKPYAACQLSHAAVDAAYRLRGRIAVADLASLSIALHPDALPIVGGTAAPADAYAAKFSAAWCVAAMLLDGTLEPDCFAAHDRPDVLALLSRVRVEPRPAPTVAADAPGRIVATLTDGRTVTTEVDRSGGGPDDPGAADLVRRKAIGAFGPGRAARLSDALDTAATVAEIVRSLG
ncbi:MmgE/PrpD family protein [Hamadaea tsunoensis]|uniref:MmgE/PrpD family protein n=1 Tax=Hamadaea tsunoensis TaxID=53368 RepID=UPI0004248BA1|nr:MmgE/PrpD family protein [Hamadaea tsunoensis]